MASHYCEDAEGLELISSQGIEAISQTKEATENIMLSSWNMQ